MCEKFNEPWYVAMSHRQYWHNVKAFKTCQYISHQRLTVRHQFREILVAKWRLRINVQFTSKQITLCTLISSKTTISNEGYDINNKLVRQCMACDVLGRIRREGLAGTSGNRGYHHVPSRALNISIYEEVTISSGNLFQYGTTRTLKAC